MPGRESPQVVTSETIYIRFHDTTGRYSGSYTKSQLQSWAKWIRDKSKKARNVYVYFNNDAHGHAIKNTGQLKNLISV